MEPENEYLNQVAIIRFAILNRLYHLGTLKLHLIVFRFHTYHTEI